jgi:hypothetical protein
MRCDIVPGVSGHVFISYSHAADVGYVQTLAAYLTAEGIPVWYDMETVPGDGWTATIREKIDTCVAFVVVMTPEAEESRWVNTEIIHAQQVGRPILPLLLRGSVFFSLNTVQYENVTGQRLPGEAYLKRVKALLPVPVSVTPAQASPQQEAGPTAPPVVDAAQPLTVARLAKRSGLLAPLVTACVVFALLAVGWLACDIVSIFSDMTWHWTTWWPVLALLLGLYTGAGTLTGILSGEDAGAAVGVGAIFGLFPTGLYIWALVAGPSTTVSSWAFGLFLAALFVLMAVAALIDVHTTRASMYERHQRIVLQARAHRWFGAAMLGEDEPLLDALTQLPSARFVRSARAMDCCGVVCGRRSLLVAAVTWPAGSYTRQPGGEFDLRHDDRPFPDGVADLAPVRKVLNEWRYADPVVRAVVIVRPAGGGQIAQLPPDDQLLFIRPERFVAEATQILADGAYELDIPTLSSALEAVGVQP